MKYGMSPGCDVCTAWHRHGITQNHSEARRRIIEAHMRQDEDSRVQRADDRTCQRITDKIKEHYGNAVRTKRQGRTHMQAIRRPRAHQEDPPSGTRTLFRIIAVHT